MKDKIGIGVLGCGRIASSGHLPAVRELSDEIDLVAVVDPIEEKALRAYENFGAKRYYLSAEEAFSDKEIDAVVLCLAHHLHCPITVDACKAGKHVLVEKPMANTYKEAEAMVKAADENGVTLMVGKSRRFYDAIKESKRRIGEIGRLYQIVTNWIAYIGEPPTDWWRSAQKAGGLLVALQGSHALDYVLWIADEMPSRVYAETRRNNPIWEGEDDVSIVLGFDSGLIATVILSFTTRNGIHERYIWGSKGTMHIVGETTLQVNGQTVVEGEQKPGNFVLQLEELLGAIREGRKPIASGDEVKKVVKVLEEVRKSAAEHKVAYL